MYKILERVASPDEFMRLRRVSGLSERPQKAVEARLKNSLFGVVATVSGSVIGMGRVIGDGALNFEIVDIAVDPEYQGKGIGRDIMKAIMKYIQTNVLPGAYVCLMADEPEFYKKFGFTLIRPESEGMVYQMHS